MCAVIQIYQMNNIIDNSKLNQVNFSKSKIKLFINNPRLFAGIFSGSYFIVLLIYLNQGITLAFLFSISWFLGLLFGGKYLLLNWLFRNSKSSIPNINMYWGGAFWAGLITVFLIGLIFTDFKISITILNALTSPFSFCYGLCKLGCFKFNCCGWKENTKCTQTFPLQVIEFILSLLLSFLIIFIFFINPSSLLSLASFGIGHGLIRCFSVSSRNKSKKLIELILRFDSGIIFLSGLFVFTLSFFLNNFSL